MGVVFTAKEQKTNVMRILDREKVDYQIRSYDTGDGKIDGVSVAAKLNEDPAQVFKTLVTKGKDYHVFVIPVDRELCRKAAAKTVGEKAVELIPADSLLPVTGYIRGGCSPIGMKKLFSTVVDDSCLAYPVIFYSAGKIGTQVGTSPAVLLRLTHGKTAPLTE